MKKNIVKLIVLLSAGMSFVACSNDDKLDSNSYLPTEDNTKVNKVDKYLDDTFVKPWNMSVHYKWDRNIYGNTVDNSRNLTPPKLSSVEPAMEMVDKVWIQSYVKVAGRHFLGKIRPGKLLLAGSYAFNENGTRTLGLASSGVQITLYELDYLERNVETAKEFIHTIQHEYIHIINQDTEFDELAFGKNTMGEYDPQWYNFPPDLEAKGWEANKYSNILGFVTAYSRSNIIEDFAETASYLLTHEPQEYQAMLAEIRRIDGLTEAERINLGLTAEFYKPGGADKIEYKANQVREYFMKSFGIDFDELCREANKNASESPMLNRDLVGSGIVAPYSKKTYQVNNKSEGVVRFCQGHADVVKQLKEKGL